MEIKEISYRENFIVVNFSTGESIRLPIDISEIYHLKNGKVIDQAEYSGLKQEAEAFGCRQKALSYLAVRNRASAEMERYLIKKGFSGDHIKSVIMRLKDKGLIDDYVFAVGYINSRKGRKAIGQNLLKSELIKKGIDRNIIKNAIAETGMDKVDMDELYDLAIRKLLKLQNKKNKFHKLAYFLIHRGYSQEEVHSVMERIKKEEIE